MPSDKTYIPEYIKGLNESQCQAVMHDKGPALVLAGPGSGKTTVIVRRILYLVRERHVPPEKILVVTFTKDAALSMQQRFLQQADNSYPVNFGTFHSVFYRILLQSHYIKPNSRLIDYSHKKNLMTGILREFCVRNIINSPNSTNKESLDAEADCFLAAIGYYKNTCDMKAASERVSVGWRDYFADVFEMYQRKIRAQSVMDFDDMVYECRKFLKDDPEQRRYWQNRFDYIMIDEFQDINPLQYEVVTLLGAGHGNLFAVGDDDQAIYRFRGSHPECLRKFARELNAAQIILNANYRSLGEIVEASEKVIAQNRERFIKHCYAANDMSVNDDVSGVRIKSFTDSGRELSYLTEELSGIVRQYPEESCAVLFRTNVSMMKLAAILSKEGIPYRMKEKTANPYEHFIVKDIMDYLRLAGGDRERAVFLRIMNRPFRHIDRDSVAGGGEIDFGRMRNWYIRRKRPEDDKIIEMLKKLETQLANMKNMSPALAVTYILKAVGYEDYLRHRKDSVEHLEEWMEVIEFLKEDSRGYESWSQWNRAQEAFAVSLKESGSAENGQSAGFIQLMTAHASKGLEFDRVYMPDCNEKVYPYGNMPDTDTVEEERRIFYVGMTRAKKYLELLFLTGTKERPRIMSRFLNPLKSINSIKQMQ